MSTSPNQQPSAAPDSRHRRPRWALLTTAVASVLLAALALWWFTRSGREATQTPVQAAASAGAPPSADLAMTPTAATAIPKALRSPESAAPTMPLLPPGQALGPPAPVDDPDWENGVLSGRLSLHAVMFLDDSMRGDLTSKMLMSDRFAEWVAKVPTATTDHALARDYAEVVRGAAAAVPGDWTPPRTACSDRICVLWFQGGPMDDRAWMDAFARGSGRLSRVLTAHTIRLPNGRFEYRYAIAVDPAIISASSYIR